MNLRQNRRVKPTPSFQINVKVTPRSSKSLVEACSDWEWKVWVNAPPADGQANAAVIELVAKSLRIGKNAVAIVRGQSSREKTLSIQGLDLDEAMSRLGKPKLL